MMMNPFVRFVSRLAACAALSCVYAVGSSAHAGFITEALDVIEAATLGSPSSDDSSPEITSYSLQSTGSPNGIVEFAELQLIGDTGHGTGFTSSLFGAGLGGPSLAGKSAGGGSGSGSGGSGGSGGVTGYQFHASGGFFAGVVAPGALPVTGQNSFTLEVGGSTSTLAGGSVATFGPGVTDFVVSGIDPGAGLLPTDPSPFNPILTGIGGTVTVTPITSSVDAVAVVHNNPEPGSLTLLGLGVAGLLVWRRRSKKETAA